MTGMIVAIDDSASNLLMIEEYLADEPYALTAFDNPEQALESLHGDLTPNVVLLDRMMPGMDGIAFLREMRRIERLRRTPVIMQTAAATPQQVAEGLSEGVFYYLTKPFSREVLLAVLRNALNDRETYVRLEQFLRKADLALSRVLDCHFHFRTLEDVDSISAFLARMYPVPADALVGIRELMLNAVEHGNLAITYAEKSKLHAEGEWASEITRRLELPDYAKRRAHVALSRVDDGIALTIQDEGDGFDWARYASFDASRATDVHGRGIAMSRAISFDDIQYWAPGNHVRAFKRTMAGAP